ncbi:rubrerythrin [Haliovirga abyssi]|uniref:Rubrerythrin n=1 Tax=Haliovirga abyssi TaxID=2996794 RepID=A0AAU9D578_9FUSO|nr:rubrerythrin family protein [Haliovirga abyssi]BDU51221.1 rubrerythrin [Haliovirga abyssi]
MKSLKGTETEKNLLKSFAGESQARNRYTYFASQAKKDGYKQIEAIFIETADNEKEHAKRFFKFLEGGDLEITATYPAGKIGTTLENLKAAAAGENEEWTELYPEFARVAEKEGFAEVAQAYKAISKVEKEHEERYKKLIENIENDKVFKKSEVVRWKCRNCGYVYEGEEAPAKCPACLHPRDYFELKEKNY